MTIQINGTSGISGVDGSATTPALQGTDTNTGISFGTDEVNVVTGGSTRATVDASGRLLVGTSSSSANTTLVLQGNSASSTSTGILTLARGIATPPNYSTIGEIDFTANNHDEPAAYIYAARDGGTWTSGSSQPSSLHFSTTSDGSASPVERMLVRSNGILQVYAAYTSTTAAAANVSVDSSGFFQRSTSSAKYKTNIETLEDSYADALLDCRPVWYRSTCEGDNPEHGWWGFIAEEVAEIDPRLVHWKTTEITHDEKGSAIETPCDPEPEGVAYDRFVPHLLNLIKRQKEAIKALETRVAQLEGGAS